MKSGRQLSASGISPKPGIHCLLQSAAAKCIGFRTALSMSHRRMKSSSSLSRICIGHQSTGARGQVRSNMRFERTSDSLSGFSSAPGDAVQVRVGWNDAGSPTSALRAKVEHPFRVSSAISVSPRCATGDWLRNTGRLHSLFALANLYLARRSLLPTSG